MATKQVFSVPSYLYVVVDNVSSQAFPTLSDASHCGYDTMSVTPDFGAAVSQGAIAVSGGTGSLPDFVNAQKSILNNPATATILYKNPS
jgi:hypothetical protein